MMTFKFMNFTGIIIQSHSKLRPLLSTDKVRGIKSNVITQIQLRILKCVAYSYSIFIPTSRRLKSSGDVLEAAASRPSPSQSTALQLISKNYSESSSNKQADTEELFPFYNKPGLF